MKYSKPTYLKISQDINFFELFKLIEKESEICYFIESLGRESQERFSVIGFNPEKIFISRSVTELEIKTRKNNQCISFNSEYTSEILSTKNAYFSLRNYIDSKTISRNYSGGLFGYITYEGYNFFQSKIQLKIHPDFGLFNFGLYSDGMVYDKITGEVFYFFYKESRLELLTELIDALVGSSKNFNRKKESTVQVKFLGHSLDKKSHANIIKKTIKEIKEGNSFQVEVGMRSNYEIAGNKLEIYEKLRQVNPSPFLYYKKFFDQIILGSSPELILRLNNGELQTSPLAGTTARGADEFQDLTLARSLLNNPKEIAEHNMLVDMHRNDLGKISKFSTVKVRTLMEVKKFSHVQHISSDIVGIIKDEYDQFDALASLFPVGVVSGAPRLETVKIINKNEKQPRGVYGGAVGYFGLNGNCTFTLPIRSLFCKGNFAYTQTSSGVVFDSRAKDEFLELQRKLQAMDQVLRSFEDKKIKISK